MELFALKKVFFKFLRVCKISTCNFCVLVLHFLLEPGGFSGVFVRYLVVAFFAFVGCLYSGKGSFNERRAFVDLASLKKIVDPRWEESLGHHLIVDLYGCNPENMNSIEPVREIIIKAAHAAGATIVAQQFHQFNPIGVTGVLVLAESHLAVHTWPEKEYCAVDLFTCGKTDNLAALEILKAGFGAKECVAVEINRGVPRMSKEQPRSRL